MRDSKLKCWSCFFWSFYYFGNMEERSLTMIGMTYLECFLKYTKIILSVHPAHEV